MNETNINTSEYELKQLILKAEIEAGLQDLKQGRLTTGPEVIDRLRRRIYGSPHNHT